jgi:hypothetical protein
MKRLTKYNREQLICFDKEQTFLNNDLSIKQNDYHFAEKIIRLELNNKVLCPFCLSYDILRKFLIIKKDGINKHLAYCPFCRVSLQVKTLLTVTKMNMKEFAKWVFEYNFGKNSFFNKVNFKEWNKKLKIMGLATEFWDEYKKLKGERGDYETE